MHRQQKESNSEVFREHSSRGWCPVLYKDKKKQMVKSKQWWINDQQKQKQILQLLHDDPAGGCHFRRDKTRDKVMSRYFWHGQYDNNIFY